MYTSSSVKLFIIYARKDQPALLELKDHLRPLEKRGDLTIWYDGKILPGEKWNEAIRAELETADIVLLLVSKSFFNSEYIESEELTKALERHQKREAIVVPVIIKSVYGVNTRILKICRFYQQMGRLCQFGMMKMRHGQISQKGLVRSQQAL